MEYSIRGIVREDYSDQSTQTIDSELVVALKVKRRIEGKRREVEEQFPVDLLTVSYLDTVLGADLIASGTYTAEANSKRFLLANTKNWRLMPSSNHLAKLYETTPNILRQLTLIAQHTSLITSEIQIPEFTLAYNDNNLRGSLYPIIRASEAHYLQNARDSHSEAVLADMRNSTWYSADNGFILVNPPVLPEDASKLLALTEGNALNSKVIIDTTFFRGTQEELASIINGTEAS